MADEMFISWSKKADTFSDNVVYEEIAIRAQAHRQDVAPISDSTPRVPGHQPYVELDPLCPADDPNMICSFRLVQAAKKMMKLGYLFIFSVLHIMTSELEFTKVCIPPEPVEPETRPRRDRMHPRNLKELEEAKLMEDWMPEDIRSSQRRTVQFLNNYRPIRFAPLFTVVKSNGRHRVVVNGKPGNEVLNPPPYFTFFSPWDVVRRLRDLKTFFAFTLDIKAWFYRIPMHRKMACYYAVAPGGAYKVFRAVPMGASIAPAIGQAATVALILYRESEADDTLGVVMPIEGIPAILVIAQNGSTVGYIFICLDNIAVVCTSRALKESWERRLINNAKALNIYPFKDEGDNQWTESNFHYIGIHYASGRWRHDDDRVSRWLHRYGGPQEMAQRLSPETIQCVTGVLVWNVRLRNKHLKHLREIFRAQAKVMDESSPQPPTPLDRALFARHWEDLLRNEWQDAEPLWPLRLTHPVGCRIIVTDASDSKWSWVELLKGGVVRNPSDYFANDLAPQKIYYKELFAVLMALRTLRDEGVRNAKIFLVGDNKGVIGSLLKLLGPPAAWEMIDEVEEICMGMQYELCLRWVESDGNVAHSATHNEAITTYRTNRSWLLAGSESYVPPTDGTGPRDREGVLLASLKRSRDKT